MAYYQGDYYQGDYYAGDPFLGSLIGMGAKWLGKKIFKRGAKMAGPGTALVPGRVTNVMTQVGRGAGRIIGRGAGLVATGAAFGAGERMMMPPPPGMFSP
ncbi:hypothetical protein, partial [Gilliamella sp. CG16]|uniref:hypothetical protein n=1 Tax=Gilliamella sp. CG16 TaxID=3351503 RepID=UPI003985BF8C